MEMKRINPLIGIGVFGMNSGMLKDENLNNHQWNISNKSNVVLYFIIVLFIFTSPKPPSPSSPKTSVLAERLK